MLNANAIMSKVIDGTLIGVGVIIAVLIVRKLAPGLI